MPIDRREFLAGLSGLGAGVGLGGFSHLLPLPSPAIGPDWTPGREEFVASTCLLCPSHCGIRGRIVDGKLTRIDGNPQHPVSQGGLCAKGRAGIQLLYHPGRIVGPLERVGAPGSDEFRRITWEDALEKIAQRLGELRANGEANSVAWLTGDVTGVMDELVRRFAHVYGTPHVIREDYEDGSSAVMRLCQGIDAPPAFDLAASDLVVSFGAALAEAWWCLPQAARARGAEGNRRPRWVQVDIRHSRTAARADEWVPVRPGTYGTLALGLAYVILKEGLLDAERVRHEVLGIEDWRSETGEVVPGFRTLVLRHGRTESVTERTGVPEETVVRLAKAFGAARRPVAVWDQTVSWRSGGLSDALAIHALNILVGALNRPGGVLVQPGLPVPTLEEASDPVAPSTRSLTPGDWAARISAESPSPINALFLYHANPLASSPAAGEVANALDRVPLLVSFSPFLDETARYAHLVLPDHLYLERWQDASAPASVPTPVWGLVQPLSPPLHDTRATGDVILDIAARLGGEVAHGLPWSRVEELVEQRGKALAAAKRGGAMAESLRREELRELESRGWWLPHGQSRAEFWDSLRSRGGWFDPYYDYGDLSTVSKLPGGSVWVFSPEARELLRSTTSGLAEGFLPAGEVSSGRGEDSDYPLHLVPYRVMTLASGSTPLMPWLLEHLGLLTGDAWETWAEINPETGRRLGLVAGQSVRIESESGVFRARLRFFAGAQPDVVNVPYGLHTAVSGWGASAGANPLDAVGARRDPSTGLPDWYSTRVRVVST